jgi:hypothetical protein
MALPFCLFHSLIISLQSNQNHLVVGVLIKKGFALTV